MRWQPDSAESACSEHGADSGDARGPGARQEFTPRGGCLLVLGGLLVSVVLGLAHGCLPQLLRVRERLARCWPSRPVELSLRGREKLHSGDGEFRPAMTLVVSGLARIR